ncbi:MAG: Ig-like domain-containing protein [Bifidobacteriaceae bacterium]|nr:Ig-like domain-containing protein [Bifidobacteriaceae bacterium]
MADPIEDPGDPCGEQPADYDSRVIAYVSPSTVTVGATAKISATVVVLASGAPAPTGMVTFKDAGNVIGAVAVAANGSATLDVSDLPAGTHTIAVEYSGNAEVAASATSVTLVVGAAGPLALGTVTASTMGQAAPGVTVTVTAPATPADAILSYVWYRGSSVISAATGATYQLTASDAGRDLVVKVTAAKNGDSVTKYSNHVEVLGLTALTIAGTASPGNTLTATATYLPATATVAYQWYRGSSAISGAQSATYTLQAADAGADISAKAIVSAGGVTSAAKYSNHLQVLGASAAYLTGLAEVGSTLTLNVTLEATDATVTYNWYRGTAMIKGATGTTYEVTAADAGQDLVAKVSVTKEGVDSPAVKYSNHVVVNQ